MASRRLPGLLATCAIGVGVIGCAGGVSLPSPDLLSTATSAATASNPTAPVETGSTQPIAVAASVSAGDRNANDGLTIVDPLGDTAALGVTGSSLVPGTLVSVYSRMAAGLNRCWLKEGKPLGKTYVLHAAIAPAPSHTGDMTVHLRAPSGRRGLKAYRVELNHAGGQTRVTTTNLKLLPRQSSRLTKDLLRWAISGSDCGTHASHVPTPKRKPGARRAISSAF